MFLLGGNGGKFALHFLHKGLVVFLDRHFAQRDGIFQTGAEFFVALDLILRLLDFLQNLGRILGAVPKGRVERLRFQILQIGSGLLNAKRFSQFFEIGAHSG